MSKARALPDYVFKLISIGESCAGKTSIVNNFTSGGNNGSRYIEIPTIGIDFRMTNVVIKGKNIKLHFWDTGGQEKYRSIVQSYYKDCAGVLVCFDLTSWQSFKKVDYWINEIKSVGGQDVPLILLGNKLDLVEGRRITTKEAKCYADERGIEYFEVSAVSGVNIREAILCLVENIYKIYLEGEESCKGIKIGNELKLKPDIEEADEEGACFRDNECCVII